MDFLQNVYSKTTTFFREIFQYIVPGVTLVLAIGMMIYAKHSQAVSEDDVILYVDLINKLSLWIIILFLIISYVIGHFLYSFSFLLFWLYKLPCIKKTGEDTITFRAMTKNRAITKKLLELNKLEIALKALNIVENTKERDPHLYAEMKVFNDCP